MQALLGELQEQTKGIAIGTDRVEADLTLLHQPLREETLQERSEAGEGGQ